MHNNDTNDDLESPADQEPPDDAPDTEALAIEDSEAAQEAEIQDSASSPMSELPPEAQGEANGGPLGCCLGVTIGVLLSLVIAVIGRLYGDSLIHVLNGTLLANIRIIMGVAVFAFAIIFGLLGWRIGKRVYREYELSPRQKRKLAELERKYGKERGRRA